MSQPWQQQPQPQPGYGYPQQPAAPGGYGYPQAQQPGPYGYPQPAGAGPVPPPPPPVQGSKAGVAVLVSAVAALVLFVLYGFLSGMVVDIESQVEDALASGDPDAKVEIYQLTWLAAAIGAVIGLPVAKLAPGQVPLYWVAGLFALGAMLLGETFATAAISADGGGDESAFELFFDHFSDLWEGWTENAHGAIWVLVALAPVSAVATGYLVGGGQRPAHPGVPGAPGAPGMPGAPRSW